MHLPERPRPQYRFGAFVVDPATRELRRGGERLSSSPKVFDCIAYLVANRDRAVGHDELAAAVWGRADVTDAQLRQLMRKVRRTVADDGEQQAVIRTVAHFGFHWIAETAIEDAASAAPRSPPSTVAEPDPAAPPAARSRGGPIVRTAAYAVLVLAVVATSLGALAWSRTRGAHRADAPAAASSSAVIAVLPAQIEAGDETDTTWMRLGLMDFVAARLRKASASVVPSTDIVALGRADGSAADVAARVRAATGAGRVIAAFATHRSDGWTVRLELQDAAAASAHSPDALLAARAASDRLLGLLGFDAPPTPPEEAPSSATEWSQRVESALLTGDFVAAHRMIDTAPAAIRGLPEMQLDLARIDSAVDRADAARGRLSGLLAAMSAEDDPVLHARALSALGWLDTSSTETSLREYSEAIDLLGGQSEPIHLGNAYLGRAITNSTARRFSAAKADYAQARVLFTLANDSLRLASLDADEAALDGDFGHEAEALPLFERAAATMERFGAIDRMITPVCNQLLAHLSLLQPADALAVYRRMRPKFGGAGDGESLHFLDYLGALAVAANGRLTEARALLAAVAERADPDSEANLLALIGGSIAELDLADGRVDEAVARAAKSVVGFPARRVGSGQAEVWLTLTRALRNAGLLAEARTQTQQFAKFADETLPAAALRARLAEAELDWHGNQRMRAQQNYAAAMDLAEQSGMPREIRLIAASYGGALLDAGDLAGASSVVGRVGRWASRDYDSALLQTRLFRALGQRDAWRLALANARALAGERAIPADLQTPPVAAAELAQSLR
ncbi:MAG TPA: winged helix-turn-helix domain-containing protein [Dokdonella sp.]